MNAAFLLLVSWPWVASAEGMPDADSHPRAILYLIPTRPSGLDAHALADTIALYTRDLNLTVQTAPDDVTSPTPAEVDRLTTLLQARAASVALWCVPADDGRSVRLYAVDAQGVASKGVANVTGLRGPDINRAIALNLRAMVAPVASPGGRSTETEAPRDAARSPVPATGGETARPPPPASPPASVSPATAANRAAQASQADSGPSSMAQGVTPSPTAATPAPRSSGTARADAFANAASPVTRSRLAMGAVVEYCLAWPTQATAPHQVLALQVIGDLGADRGFEVVAGLDLARPVRRTTATGSASLFDLPLRLGGRWMLNAASPRLGIGLFGTVHLLSASATSTSRGTVDSFTAGGGAGLDVLVRGGALWRLSWEARLWAERWIPRTWFMVDQEVAIETGGYAIGLALGAGFLGP
jgi:hypothetical protein